MLLNCAALVGEELEYIKEAHIEISGSEVSFVGDGFVSGAEDLRNLLAMPGLVNAHTHIGDSFAKEACRGLSLDQAVGREGKKWELYRMVGRDAVVSAMRESVSEMLLSGTTLFADFREGGHEGLAQLRDATAGLPIRSLALGRDLGERFEDSDGLGLNLYQAGQIPADRTKLGKRLLALHAGEATGEVSCAVRFEPDVIVHATSCQSEDIPDIRKRGISVVLCPRSNAYLRVGFPPAKALLRGGVNVALGTDNVMINSPDMWREMEFLYKASQLFDGLSPTEVLKAATVNGAKALRRNSGVIEKGREADIVFIDVNAPNMRGCRDMHSGLVNRCSTRNVAGAIIRGAWVQNRRQAIYTQK